MNKDRITCVIIPNFAVEVIGKMIRHSREHQNLQGQPVAVVTMLSDTSPIIGVNRIAAGEGVAVDMTVAQGRSYCSELLVMERCTKNETADSDKLFNLLLSVSPLVEQEATGRFYLDATGLKRLYKDDKGMAEKIICRVRSIRYPVKVGIGKNKFVAGVAAETGEMNTCNIITAGAERRFLNNQTLDHLPVSSDTRETLFDLGLKTIGQLAAFPANELKRRFGDEGTSLSRLSRGEDIDFFLPQFPMMKISRRISFLYPITTVREVLSNVKQILSECLSDLGRINRGSKTIRVDFLLDNYDKVEICLSLQQPVVRPDQFIRQLTSRLNNLKLLSPITDITITLPEILPLFSPQLQLDNLTGTGSALIDENNLVDPTLKQLRLSTPQLNNATIPELNFTFSPVTSKKRSIPKTPDHHTTNQYHPYALYPLAGLRLLQPSRKTTVIFSNGKLQTIRLDRKTCRIIDQQGPWILSGHWWSNSFDRQYYEIQTPHRLCLLYFDRQRTEWFLQGVFD